MLTYAVVETQVSVCLHVCHLSGPAVADRLNRSTLRRARLSARTSRPLTTVYANFQLPMCTAHIVTKWLVVSYTRLLTLTGRSRRLFSSALIKPHGLLRVRKRDALCCPDFPQISPGYQRQTVRLLFVCSAKLINSACFPIMLPYIFSKWQEIWCLSAPKTVIGGDQMGRNRGKRKISCRVSLPSYILAFAARPKTAISPAF